MCIPHALHRHDNLHNYQEKHVLFFFRIHSLTCRADGKTYGTLCSPRQLKNQQSSVQLSTLEAWLATDVLREVRKRVELLQGMEEQGQAEQGRVK